MGIVAQTAGSTFAGTRISYQVSWRVATGDGWRRFQERELFVNDLRLSTGRLLRIKRSLGTAFVCPKCPEVWGKISLRNDEGEIQDYRVWPRLCRRHGGGSLRAPYDGTDRKINDLMPLEVLIREMDIALKDS